MKAQDFMKALGGVSQEKLDALAKWQNAGTPITGKAPARETPAEPVSPERRIHMTQKNTKAGQAPRLFPWRIGIGAAIAACAVVAVSVGSEAIARNRQMQVGYSPETSVAETVSYNTVEIIDQLAVSGGNDSTMMKLPPEGAVQVLRSVEDAEACCHYSSEDVAGQPFDFRKKLTADVFAQYDVLYFGFKDAQQPQNCYSVDLAGGSIAEDGQTLHLDFHALVFDPDYLPSEWCSETEPDWNTYYFYTVPKNSLPDLSAIKVSFEEYRLGEIPEDILANPHEKVGVADDGTTTMALKQYLETTQEYLDWVMSMPKPKYIKWKSVEQETASVQENSADLPENCAEVQADSQNAVRITASVHSDDSEGRVIWKNNEGDTTIAFTYEIDMSNADTAKFVKYRAEQQADDTEPMQNEFTCELTTSDGQPLYSANTLISDAGTLLEPAEEPYLLTMHIQPLRGNGSGLAFSEFTLNTIMTVSDSKDGEPSQSFTFPNRVYKDNGFRHDGGFTFGYGIYDTDDSTKPQLETIRYSENDGMFYLCTQLTGHDNAKGDTYNVFVKIRQGSGDSTTPVLFSLTPNGQKRDGIWLNDLRQGDFEQTLTAIYPELRTDLAESEITLELWYQPDVIPPEAQYHGISENDSFEYCQHSSMTIKAECTAKEIN